MRKLVKTTVNKMNDSFLQRRFMASSGAGKNDVETGTLTSYDNDRRRFTMMVNNVPMEFGYGHIVGEIVYEHKR